MDRVRARDASAFEALYDAYHRLVYAIAFRMTDDATTAEDVTQSVFLTLWTTPEAFRGGTFNAWLCRVTRNRVLDVLRRRANRATAEIPPDLADPVSTTDKVLERIDADRVRAALAALGEDQRSIIELGFFGGITHEEIARRTGIPLGTVKTRIRTGLRRMREMLTGAPSR